MEVREHLWTFEVLVNILNILLPLIKNSDEPKLLKPDIIILIAEDKGVAFYNFFVEFGASFLQPVGNHLAILFFGYVDHIWHTP